MKKKDERTNWTDSSLQDQIIKEGKLIEKMLGPETYQDPDGFDYDASYQELLKDRMALKEQTKAYVREMDDKSVFDKDSDELPVKKKKKASRTWAKTLAKAAAVVLVAGACLAGLSLRSEATRMWWMESFGWKIGEVGYTKVNNDVERDDSEMPEWEAEAVIEKELGIQVPKFLYEPEGLEFSDYQYETMTNRATMYYHFGEEYLTISMISGADNYTSSVNFDGSVLKEETIASTYANITVRNIRNGEGGKNSTIAEWDYLDVHYEVFGRISFEEVKKMLKNMVL